MSEPDVTQELRVPWEEDPGELYDQAPCGYLTTLPDGTILKVNETFLNWTGYSRQQLVGRRRFRELLSSGGQIYHETHYAPLLRMQDDVHEIAFDVVCADGRRLPTLVSSVLGRDPAGLPRVIRTTVFNATERRGYEKELLAARRAAEASEKRVQVLQRIVADLAAEPTGVGVAEAVVRAPGPAFGAAGATTWLVESHPDRLIPAACTEESGARDELPLSSPAAVTTVARARRLRVFGSLAEAGAEFPELAEKMAAHGRVAAVLLPLTSGSADDGAAEVRGVLEFSFTEPRELSENELRVVRLLGQQAGQALERARLYDDVRLREERARFLAATTRELDETPRLQARARRLADRLVPEMADWAAVRLQVGTTGLLADAGQDPPDPAWLADRVAVVTTSGEAVLADPEDTCTVLPLMVRGRVLGTLALRMRTVPDPEFLVSLADRAGLALENARLYEQERAVARTLQRSLLAGELPRESRYVVESHYQAGAQDLEVGGDWFDAFTISPDRLALVVGDVVGRGIDAATTMGQLRSAIRALASIDNGPAAVLEKLDQFVERVESARMATVAYAEVDLASQEMTYACAGHLPPLLHEPASSPRYLMDGRSAPLGSRAGRRGRTEDTVKLAPGSRLLLYTDGLIERRTRTIDRGFEVLALEWSRRRDAPLHGLAADLADTLVGKENTDDVCLLCLTLGTDERLERSIGADPTQIALLRQDLRGWLASNEVDDETAKAVLLATSEAVANAIEHGYRNDPFGRVEIAATVSPAAIEVTVTDRGEWRDTHGDPTGGRGLHLIRELMDDVAFDHRAGTTVTMRRSRQESR